LARKTVPKETEWHTEKRCLAQHRIMEGIVFSVLKEWGGDEAPGLQFV
jgi:hypothetical protein